MRFFDPSDTATAQPSQARSRRREEILDRFKWNLSDIFRNWEDWEAAYKKIEAGIELTYRACDLFNRKIPCVKEISMAKLFTSELANRVAYECLQVFGGYGYIEEYDIARSFRDVRLITIGAGTSEIMREIIAKETGLA